MKLSSRFPTVAVVALLSVLAFGLPSAASALPVPVTLNNPSAGFSNPQPVGGNLGNSNITWPDGANGDEIRFGVPTNQPVKNPTRQQSGLRFDVFAAPFDVNIGDIFDLGTLTHFNWEVRSGTSIRGAVLTFDFDIAGSNPPHLSFSFNLGVDETDNKAAGCANTPVTPGNWCPDIISFPQMGGGETFTLDGRTYTLNLLGFGPTANNLQSAFITQEFQDNSTHLWATISSPTTQVPEPGALSLMALGLFGVGGVLTYRQHKRKEGRRQV